MVKEITIKFSMAYGTTDFKVVVEDLCAGKFSGCEKIISARISLDDFEELIHRKDKHLKIVVTPRKDFVFRSG